MDTTRFVFFSALFASLLLAAPAFTDPPSPTPSATPPSWIGIGKLTGIQDMKYKLWACKGTAPDGSFQVNPNSDIVEELCYPVTEVPGDPSKNRIEWDETPVHGTVIGNWATFPAGYDYTWTRYLPGASEFNAHDHTITGLGVTPYKDPTNGGVIGAGGGYSLTICIASNTTSTQRSSINKDWPSRGGQGTGLCSTSCPQQSFNVGKCWMNVGTCSGIAGCCFCNDTTGRYVLPVNPSVDSTSCTSTASDCSNLYSEAILAGGAIRVAR